MTKPQEKDDKNSKKPPKEPQEDLHRPGTRWAKHLQAAPIRPSGHASRIEVAIGG